MQKRTSSRKFCKKHSLFILTDSVQVFHSFASCNYANWRNLFQKQLPTSFLKNRQNDVFFIRETSVILHIKKLKRDLVRLSNTFQGLFSDFGCPHESCLFFFTFFFSKTFLQVAYKNVQLWKTLIRTIVILIVNFEHISHLVLMFLLWTLSR